LCGANAHRGKGLPSLKDDRPATDLHYRAGVLHEASGDIVRAVESGRCPLLLTGRTKHLQYFEAKLAGVAKNVFFLKGGMGKQQMHRSVPRGCPPRSVFRRPPPSRGTREDHRAKSCHRTRKPRKRRSELNRVAVGVYARRSSETGAGFPETGFRLFPNDRIQRSRSPA